MSIHQYFGLKEAGVSVGSELRAGLTTFLTMSYILFVNPLILGDAIQGENMVASLTTATAVAAAFGSLLMGLWARYPYALAPGMGLNAYFAYSVVIGQGIPWETALGAVFLSGLLFLVISLVGARKMLINAIPRGLKFSVTAGIGAFLAMIGLKNGGLVVDSPATLVTMGDLSSAAPLMTFLGLLVTTVLLARGVKGAVLVGIVTVVACTLALDLPVYNGERFPGFADQIVSVPVWPKDLFLAMDLGAALNMGALTVVFTFLFVDFFDSAGTLIGLSEKAGKLEKDGSMKYPRAAFSADAIATSFGAMFGTSSTTCYIESAAGIEEGGRTGLTAVTVGVLFLLSMFFWPIIAAAPAAASAPALIVIGAMMMFSTAKVDWQDAKESIPALLTILGMPLTFSITNGIALGLVSYCLIHLFSGAHKKIHPLLYVLTILLILRFAYFSGG